jgi:hypothetical protein
LQLGAEGLCYKLLFSSFSAFATIIIITMIRRPSTRSRDDPLSLALQPPPFETDEERAARVRDEIRAKEASDKIDEEIKLEKQRLQKANGDVKVFYFNGIARVALFYRGVASITAPFAWPSRVGQIYPTETIPVNV